MALALERAISLAVSAHSGQVDKAGKIYVLHCLRVMNSVLELGMDEASSCAAVLHDIVEDTPVTLEELAEQGFSARVVELVDFLTRRKDETHQQYLERLKPDSDARNIKLVDVRDNFDRIFDLSEPERSGLGQRYLKAMLYLG